MSKNRFKGLFLTAITLLSTGSLIWTRWESPIVVVVVPAFLFALVCFVVILRHKEV
jgi:ABC-type transport system involved in multi-copper enzyme maturation permease subunit